MKILVIEDNVERCRAFKTRLIGNEIHIARNAPRARRLLERESYDLVFFDHDLKHEHYGKDDPEDPTTGFGVAKWLVSIPEFLEKHKNFITHSLNEVGRMRIRECLEEVGKTCIEVPWIWEKEEVLKMHLQQIEAGGE